MSRLYFISSVLMLLSGSIFHAYAGSMSYLQDTVKVVSSVADTSSRTESTSVADSLSLLPKKKLNAFDYSMMRRWRPKDEVKFVSGRFIDNTFISLSGSGYRVFRHDYSSGPHLSLSFGKWLNAFHALRLSVGTGYYFDNFDGNRLKQVDAGLSYMFNFSSYLGGYRPSRLCEISGVAGIGYSYLWRKEHSGHAATAHIGMNFNLHILKDVDLFVEPLFLLSSDGLAIARTNNWRRYFGAFSGSVGMSYRFDPAGFPGRGPSRKWFVFLTGGTQVQNSFIIHHDMDAKSAFGMHFNTGAGLWCGDFFAVRLSAAYSRNNWMKTVAGDCLSTDYAVLRLEGMLDFVALFNKMEDSVFSASLLFGPETGYMFKKDIGRNMVIPYVGMTGGVQAKVRVYRRFSVFIEPRFSFVPYPAPSDDRTSVNVNRNYYDGLLNCSLGIEYAL